MLRNISGLAASVTLCLAFLLSACGKEEEPVVKNSSAVTDALKGQIDAALIAKGAELFKSKKCFSCHMVKGEKKLIGPTLAGIGQRMDVETLETWIRHPKQLKPRTMMPAFDGGDDQLIALIAWLRTL